jgi:hypothetical protein
MGQERGRYRMLGTLRVVVVDGEKSEESSRIEYGLTMASRKMVFNWKIQVANIAEDVGSNIQALHGDYDIFIFL